MHFLRQYVFSQLKTCMMWQAAALLPGIAFAQASVHADTSSMPLSSVTLIADARIELLAHYNDAPGKANNAIPAATSKKAVVSGSIRSVPGYRVIIYSGTERNKANGVKIDFMRRFPGMRVYMSYAMPQYRVKVGDFTSRAEAAVLYQQLNKVYSPCLIVPDIVEINTFHRANDPANTAKEP